MERHIDFVDGCCDVSFKRQVVDICAHMLKSEFFWVKSYNCQFLNLNVWYFDICCSKFIEAIYVELEFLEFGNFDPGVTVCSGKTQSNGVEGFLTNLATVL